jgi:O-antigen ligase
LLAGLAIFLLMAGMRLLKLRQVIVATVVVGLFIVVVEPAVLWRMASLERLTGLFFRQSAAAQPPDSSAVRRYVLNVATWHVFLDHPLLGVGPGQFSKHYSAEYGNKIGLIEQRKTYRGHNLYLETLAETGLIGLLSFLSIMFVIMYGLWKARSRLMRTRPDLAATASAFLLCLAAYSISAIFDHLAYQRYLWLLLALSSATIRIVYSHSQERSMTEPSLRQSNA